MWLPTVCRNTLWWQVVVHTVSIHLEGCWCQSPNGGGLHWVMWFTSVTRTTRDGRHRPAYFSKVPQTAHPTVELSGPIVLLRDSAKVALLERRQIAHGCRQPIRKCAVVVIQAGRVMLRRQQLGVAQPAWLAPARSHNTAPRSR